MEDTNIEKPKVKEKIYICNINDCNAKFNRPSKLEVHLRKHTEERPFFCTECDKTYTNESHLRRHKKTTHLKTKTKPIRCPHAGCHRELANINTYKKHLKLCHNPERKFKYGCDTCTKSFWKKSQLTAHSFQHTGVPPFTCDYCQVGFMYLYQFQKHKNDHKTFECKCNKVFYRWSDYLKHRKICDDYKQFSYNAKLERKLKQKDDEIIFTCSYEGCYRFYKYKKNLQTHINVFHLKKKTKVIQCPFPGCEKTLSKNQNLRTHMKLHDVKTEKTAKRKERKDKGAVKKSSALLLSGLVCPYEAEKKVVQGENVELYFENVEDISDKQSSADEDDEPSNKRLELMTVNSCSKEISKIPNLVENIIQKCL